MYMTVKEAAVKWGISDRRIRVLCSEGKIPGAYQEGRGWKIPIDAEKPADGRFRSKESILSQIDRKKAELDGRRPLTEGELERLNEEFTVEYTYNSNAIEGNTLTLRETDLVLRGLTIDKKPLKDHMEAVGHKEAFDYVRELVKEKAPLTESIINRSTTLSLPTKRTIAVFTEGFPFVLWVPATNLCSRILSSRKWNSSCKATPQVRNIT